MHDSISPSFFFFFQRCRMREREREIASFVYVLGLKRVGFGANGAIWELGGV